MTFSSIIKISQFMALYVYHPLSITSPLKGTTKFQVVEDHIEKKKEVLKLLKDKLVATQNRMKQQAHQHHIEREFEVGYWVFMRLKPHNHISLKKQNKENKLEPKYYGPYKVLQRIGSMTYKLELYPYSHVHPIFHDSCLKKVNHDKTHHS
jgi:hypothetical protein